MCSARGQPSRNAPSSLSPLTLCLERRCRFCDSALDQQERLFDPDSPIARPETLARAYAVCRAIAKREAKNFLLRFRRSSSRAPQRHLRYLRLHASGRRLADNESLSRQERAAPPGCVAGSVARGCKRRGHQRSCVFLPCATRQGALRFHSLCWTNSWLASSSMWTTFPPALPHTYAPLPISTSYCYPGRQACLGRRPGLHPHLRLPRPARRKGWRRETGIAFQLTNIFARCGRGRRA